MIVVSFFDYTGVAVEPWAEAGYTCLCFDIQHNDTRRGNINFVHADLSPGSVHWERINEWAKDKDIRFVFGFPPCTELAVSGTRHWASKAEIDPKFQDKAAAMAITPATFANKFKLPYVIENPIGVLPKYWRKYNYKFSPYEYGGYLPIIDSHPLYDEWIAPRDAYSKPTCLWTGNGFIMPEPKLVPYKQHKKGNVTSNQQTIKLGGKSLKTKNIRSATPRGFALAVFLANHTTKSD